MAWRDTELMREFHLAQSPTSAPLAHRDTRYTPRHLFEPNVCAGLNHYLEGNRRAYLGGEDCVHDHNTETHRAAAAHGPAPGIRRGRRRPDPAGRHRICLPGVPDSDERGAGPHAV